METMDLAVEEVMRQKLASSNTYAPRNVHPLIFRLPTEILEAIFIQCASDYHRRYDGRPRSAAPSWVNVSYVCHHWRHVALDCATMWTYIFITSQRWTEELLARSKQASLKIRFNLLFESRSTSQWLNTVEKLMDHLERIQELCLGFPEPYEQVLSKRLYSPAPRLQTLDMDLYVGSPPEWSSLLFGGVPPTLHTLKLSHCWVPLSSFKLHTLTAFHLCQVPDRFQQNIEQLLAVVGYMKNLEHLYLEHALASATSFLSSVVFRKFKKIDLPYLSYFLILAPVSTTIALLSCVNIPSKTTIELDTLTEPNFPFHNYALLYSLFTQRCNMAEDHALSSSTILSLDVEIMEGRSEGTFTFSASERDFPVEPGEEEQEEEDDEDEDEDDEDEDDEDDKDEDEDDEDDEDEEEGDEEEQEEQWASNIPLRIHFRLSEGDGDLEAFIRNICSSMPLSNVRSLRIMQPPFSSAFWRNMLGHLRDIRYIKLEAANMPDLSILSLTNLTTDEGGQGQSDMLAPHLQELVLDWIEFLPEGDSDRPEPAITRRSLFDALSTRQSPHGRLTMTNCTIGDSDTFDSVMVWGDGGIHVVSDSEDREE